MERGEGDGSVSEVGGVGGHGGMAPGSCRQAEREGAGLGLGERL